jgi:hypothetical protein
MTLVPVSEIAAALNNDALDLCAQYLPNGRRAGNKWMAANIWDTGKGSSLFVGLTGSQAGRWKDTGGCAAGEDHGDMLDLIAIRACGGDKRQAIALAKERLGIVDAWSPKDGANHDPAQQSQRAAEARARAEKRQADDAKEVQAKIPRARALFLRASNRPIKDTPAAYYLENRGLGGCAKGTWPNALRFSGEVYHAGAGVKLPAMLAAVYLPSGVHVATHRTFLQHSAQRGWVKSDASPAKMVLGPCGGGFIPIHKGRSGKSMAGMPDGEPVYMAEGIEKCIAMRILMPSARIICGLNLGNMGAIVLPERARKLILVCDRDDHPNALDALERVISRHQARGVEVHYVMPPEPFNDIDEWMLWTRGNPAMLGRAV